MTSSPAVAGPAVPGRFALFPVAFACALLALAGSCSKDVSYTYVNVHVTVDRTTVTSGQLQLVTSCEVQVVGPGVDETVSLRCRENRVPYDVGRFQWTSDAKTGTLQFIVRILNANKVIIGEVTSNPVLVSPGKQIDLELVVLGVLPPAAPDGGTDDAASAPDAATTTDAAGADVVPDGGVPSLDAPSEQPTGPDAASGDASAPDASADRGLDTVPADAGPG